MAHKPFSWRFSCSNSNSQQNIGKELFWTGSGWESPYICADVPWPLTLRLQKRQLFFHWAIFPPRCLLWLLCLCDLVCRAKGQKTSLFMGRVPRRAWNQEQTFIPHTPLLLQGHCRAKGAVDGELCCTLCLIQRFLCPGKTFCWLLQTPGQMFSHLPKVAILLYKHPAHLCCFWFQSSFTRLEIILVWYTSLPVKANPCPPCQSKHSYKGRGITLTVHKICFHIMLYRTHCCWHFLHLYYMNLLYLLDWHSG